MIILILVSGDFPDSCENYEDYGDGADKEHCRLLRVAVVIRTYQGLSRGLSILSGVMKVEQ